VAAFGDRFRILRYDQRGHGGSAVPSGDCHFDRLVADLAALMHHFGIVQSSVAGVSMGGITAIGLAARHPDLVARVLISDCGPASSPAGAAAWDERIAVVRAGGMAALVEPTIGRWFHPESVDAELPGIARVRNMIRTTPPGGFIRAARALQDYDFSAELAAIACPARLVAGEADAALPEVMRGMTACCQGAVFAPIAGAGHLPNIEQPALFNNELAALLAA
jgi:3-oxoadipate enol-lactonase